MGMYRKRPVEVEAREIDTMEHDEACKILKWCGARVVGVMEHATHDDVIATIKTLEGVMDIRNHDFIIEGVNGEFYPCKPDIFYKTYERAD